MSDYDYIPPSATESMIRGKTLAGMELSDALAQALLPMQIKSAGLVAVPSDQPTPHDAAHFDAQKYLEANPDIARFGVFAGDPYSHYVQYGQQEGREGYWKTTPADYSYRNMTEEELLANMSPLERRQYELANLQADRLEKALKGELP